MLALAREGAVSVGNHGTSGARRSTVKVKVWEADPEGRPVAVAGEVHETAHGHAHDIRSFVVGVRAVLAEGGYGHHHQGLVDIGEVIIAQAQAIQVPWREGLDEEMGPLYQRFEKLPSVGGMQVQGNAPLVDCVGPPEEALFGLDIIMVKRANVPGGASPGGLHLDNVGPQVGQNLTAKQPPFVSEVEDAIRA